MNLDLTSSNAVAKAALEGRVETIIVAETGETVRALRCPVSIGDRTYDIFVPGDSDDDISDAITSHRYSFPEHYALLLELAPPGGRVLDLGAHLGTFSLFAAAHGYQVLAVEASPRNAALLKATITSRLDTVTIMLGAVGDHDGDLEFVQAGAYGHVAGASGTAQAIRVPAFTVDRLVSQHGWNEVDFVKMDIEGSEVAAIEGMRRLLAGSRAPVILYESNGHTLGFFARTPRDVRSRLASSGYDCFMVRPHQLVPLAVDDLQLECIVDCVAMKRCPIALNGWEIAAGLDPWSRRFLAERSCTDPNPVVRAYAGRALQAAEPAFLTEWKIASALNALKKDPDPDVRQAVAWWHPDRWVLLRALRHYIRAGGRLLKSLLTPHNQGAR
jgi:FkbM family methyltransferase